MGWHQTVHVSREAALEIYVERKYGEIDDATIEKFLDGLLYAKGYNVIIVRNEGANTEDHILDLIRDNGRDDDIDTKPLLRLLRDDGGRSKSLNLSYIKDSDIPNTVIEEADRRGEIKSIGDNGTTYYILTECGEEALEEED